MPTALSLDPASTEISERSRTVLMGILAEIGVNIQEFTELGDGELQVEALLRAMGRIWVVHARSSGLEEEWRKELENRKRDVEGLFARFYFRAAEDLGKGATETAKKNWISINAPEVGTAEDRVREADYMVALTRAARRAIEIRVDMLQSINKLRVSELDRLHVHLRAGDGG